MAGSGPNVLATLPGEQWELLLQQTLQFAEYQIARLRWRGSVGGVLPSGFDPPSLAAQAIADFLRDPNFHSINIPLPGEAKSRFIKIPLIQPSEIHAENDTDPDSLLTPPAQAILWQINRIILRIVTRLHHRKENRLLLNAPDLVPVQDQDGQLVNPLELIPGIDTPPDEALLQKESLIEWHFLKTRFELFLAKDRPLIKLFELNWDGLSKPQSLAAHLQLPVRRVENLRKRLQRKWLRFRQPSNQ
jgi:hypothetical protein